MQFPSKTHVREALLLALEDALAKMAHAARESRAGATSEESKAEGDKDMRSTEQSYLARGQAMRTEELAEHLQRLAVFALPSFDAQSAIAAGALVRVLVDAEPRMLFVVPFGAGVVLHVDGVDVTVVTPSSPVGQALLGKFVGDEFELRTRGVVREWSVQAVT